MNRIALIAFFGLLLIHQLGCKHRLQLNDNQRATHSLLHGYRSQCSGSILIKPYPTSPSVAGAIVPAGNQKILLLFRSDPYFPDPIRGNTLAGYRCWEVGDYIVSFNSRPGESYRFHLDRSSLGNYQMEVYQLVDPGSPEARIIAAKSEQLSLIEQCGFLTERCE